MLSSHCIPLIICLFLLTFMLETPFASGQEAGKLETPFVGHGLSTAEFEKGGPAAVDPETADMQTELRVLKDEMLRMKRSYDLKLAEMGDKISALEEEKERHNWGKLETMPYVRNTAVNANEMTPEEKAKIEEELKAIMGEPGEKEVPKAAEYPAAPETGFLGGLFTRMGTGRGILQTYNPDISVIGDFTGTFMHPGDGRGTFNFGERNFEGREFADRFALREIELGFMAALDPYARGDFFIGIHEGAIEVEEGYITLLTLPKGLQAKVGQFKPAVGKVSRTHRPEIFQFDYPLIVRNLFGEEALRDPGLSISWFIPNPWDKYIELTGEVMTTRGLNEPYYVLHLKNFFDLTLNSSLEVGLTGFTGDLKTAFEAGTSDVRANMVGLDLTYRWKPVTYKTKPYKSLLWQAEAFFTQVDDIDDISVNEEGVIRRINDKEDSWGAYTFGEYQLTRRTYAGLRLDYAQSLVNNRDFEWAISPYWTFWQSDFVRWRLQYTHTQRRIDSFRGPSSDDAIMLQSTWSMGIHRPHPF